MDEMDMNTLYRYFKAVGQLERLKTLGLLASRPHTVVDSGLLKRYNGI
jgi:hypothetical protein